MWIVTDHRAITRLSTVWGNPKRLGVGLLVSDERWTEHFINHVVKTDALDDRMQLRNVV